MNHIYRVNKYTYARYCTETDLFFKNYQIQIRIWWWNFRIWIRQKGPDPTGSGSATLVENNKCFFFVLEWFWMKEIMDKTADMRYCGSVQFFLFQGSGSRQKSQGGSKDLAQQQLAKYYYKGSFSYYSYKDFLCHLQSMLAFFQLRILSLSMLELII
jgi:hypothetical protein